MVFRKTYGFNKKEDKISLSQFAGITGLSRPKVCRSINKLKLMGLVTVTKKENSDNIFSINKDYSTWKPLPKKVVFPKKVKSVPKKGNSSLPKKGHTKDNTTKVDTKDIAGVGKIKKEKEQSALIPDVIYEFVKFNPSCKKFYNNTIQRQACQDLLDEYGFDQVRKVIASLPISNKISYFPIIATPLQLWHNYQKLQDKWVQYKNKNKSKHNEPNYVL